MDNPNIFGWGEARPIYKIWARFWDQCDFVSRRHHSPLGKDSAVERQLSEAYLSWQR